ncbi:non-specific lipid transfer protein GPI-anchored 8 [Benincasa hispida]|uniref:non-specific lipid transfer protein GPI-anchored 8 n=1 Tax=Benincasa hispida TaxID=102211 RepID=UPI0018FF7D88|nr:non-specific lipid transfer protein GPI-anchored 8 [Benincasa hispida]
MARSEVSVAVAVVAVVVVLVAVSFVEAQLPDCASKLVPCADFLKSNNPPATCCDPIKEAVATQLECLCNLYSSPDFLSSIGVNVSDALHLTKACGVPVELSKCKTGAPAPQQGAPSPPAVPGNDAEKLVSTGFTSMLLFLAPLVFY